MSHDSSHFCFYKLSSFLVPVLLISQTLSNKVVAVLSSGAVVVVIVMYLRDCTVYVLKFWSSRVLST